MVRASRVVSFLPSASLNSWPHTEHTQWALTPVSVQVAGTSATADSLWPSAGMGWVRTSV